MSTLTASGMKISGDLGLSLRTSRLCPLGSFKWEGHAVPTLPLPPSTWAGETTRSFSKPLYASQGQGRSVPLGSCDVFAFALSCLQLVGFLYLFPLKVEVQFRNKEHRQLKFQRS